MSETPDADLDETPQAQVPQGPPGSAATAAFEQTLDLEEERRASRRTETWIFFRAFLIVMFVVIVIYLRSVAL